MATPHRRLVVHIGMAKTGTTSIQQALYTARESLATVGVLYPLTDRDLGVLEQHPKHGHLAHAAWRGTLPTIDAARARLRQEIEASGAHTVVVSGEGLSGPGPRGAEFFRPFAADHTIEVVCYLRRQDRFAESVFNQLVKRGVGHDEPRDIVSFIAGDAMRRRMDYHALLQRWRGIGARVIAADFEQARAGDRLMAHFAAAAGLGSVPIDELRRNPSPDMRAILVACALQATGRQPDMRALLRAAEQVQAEAGPPWRHLLGRRLRAELLASFRTSNERLAAEFGVHFDAQRPDREDEEPRLAPPPGYLELLLPHLRGRARSAEAAAARPALASRASARVTPVAAPAPARGGRVYIYTVPKAGTYLMSAFVDALGWASSGWHVAQNHVLHTLAHDAQTNRETPSRTRVPGSYLDSLRNLPEGQHAFGHMSPLYVPTTLLRDKGYRMLALRRHPREVLVSEFIDFRHRRRDVEWVSEARVPDPQQAFALYVAQHGPAIHDICRQQLLLQQVHALPEHLDACGGQRVLFVDLRSFLDASTGPAEAARIAAFLGSPHDGSAAAALRAQALAADNKTKATELVLPYPRESLWTPEAEAAYGHLGFDPLACRMGY